MGDDRYLNRLSLRILTTLAVVSATQVLFSISASAQLKPACIGNAIPLWTNCVGVIVWPNGQRYDGEIVMGAPNGKGKVIFSTGDFEGDVYEGTFRNGVFEGPAVYTHKNGFKYVGGYRNNKREGAGVLYNTDGSVHSLELYKNGMPIVQDVQISTSAQSLWDHDGSQMRLEVHGHYRKFIYDTPRQGITAKPGDVLYEGIDDGRSDTGTAYLYSAKCGLIAYRVLAVRVEGLKYVGLNAQVPRPDTECKVTSHVSSTLVFTNKNLRGTWYSTSNVVLSQTAVSGQSAADRCAIASKQNETTACDAAIRENPQDFVSLNNKSRVWIARKEYDKVVSDSTNAININPKYAPAYLGRGIAYRLMGQQELALADLGNAIKFNPNFPVSYHNRGLIFYSKNLLEKAKNEFSEAVRVDSKAWYAYAARSTVYEDQGRLDLAISDMRSVRLIVPNDTNHRDRLADLEARVQAEISAKRSAKVEEIMGRGNLTTSQKNVLIQKLQDN